MRGQPPSTLRVLVVEDNADSAEILALIIRSWGHEVVVAHDGPEAIRAAGAYRPHAVLLDISLPLMDGFEVARRLRQLPGGEGTWIAAASGYNRESDRRRADEAGFDSYLVKPFDALGLQGVLARRCPTPEPATA